MSAEASRLIPLTHWLLEAGSNDPICQRVGTPRTRTQLVTDVANLCARLRAQPAGRWLVCTESASACTTALLALWQCGSRAVLAPNMESGSLRDLARGAEGCLIDGAIGIDGVAPLDGLIRMPVYAGLTAPIPAWHELEATQVALELCTSGSTGARKIVAKTFEQLQAEIATLERAFGSECAGLRVLGTTSHQHIYGLLFRVLWPLCAGRSFDDRSLADPGALVTELSGDGAALLVGTPAHLKRLPELAELARFAGRLRLVFSSGGPLDAGTARRYEAALGNAPVEVFGSTETGGIAWRRQSSSAVDAGWNPFEGVRIETHAGALRVHSVAAGSAAGVATGDLVECLSDGRFLLHGRADRIVKLFDERVALTEVEARLATHEWVEEAAALTIERGGVTRLGVVLVLRAEAGALLLARGGRVRVIAGLRAALAAYLRPTALPRAYRFVERMPADAQGKTSLQALRELFSTASRSSAARLLQRELANEAALQVLLEVPTDLWCLDGHFPDLPVVPGVVQLQWVLDWARQWLGTPVPLARIERLKFRQILQSGARFRLRVELQGNGKELRFRLWDEQAEYSSGRLYVGERATT